MNRLSKTIITSVATVSLLEGGPFSFLHRNSPVERATRAAMKAVRNAPIVDIDSEAVRNRSEQACLLLPQVYVPFKLVGPTSDIPPQLMKYASTVKLFDPTPANFFCTPGGGRLAYGHGALDPDLKSIPVIEWEVRMSDPNHVHRHNLHRVK